MVITERARKLDSWGVTLGDRERKYFLRGAEVSSYPRRIRTGDEYALDSHVNDCF